MTPTSNDHVGTSPWKQFLAVISHSGDSLVWLSAMVVVALWQGGYWRDWALTMIVAMLFVGLLVKIMKLIWRRQRPTGDWGKIYRRTDPYSFPSGHAARAGLLLVMSLALGPLWLGLLLLVWAPLVSYSRLYLRLHVPFEVVCGFLLGILSGLVIAITLSYHPIDFTALVASWSS
jgi:undecaprenyl-diphosphatase